MLLKKMQYFKKKTNILSLSILFYNKCKIKKNLTIFRKLMQYLDFNNYVFEDKIMIVKKNWLTVQNITLPIYQKKENRNILYILG